MRSILPWVAALILSLVGAVQAWERAPAFAPATAVLVVGEVSSPPKVRLGEQKLQVAIGPERTDYTLHFFGARVLGIDGRPLSEGDFHHGMWVRAEGRIMKDPRRVKVSSLQVIANNRAAVTRSALLPPGLDQGFITSVAGSRQTFPEATAGVGKASPMVIVGKLGEDYRPRDGASEFSLQAAAADWRVEVPLDARLIDLAGGKLSPRDLSAGQWVRVCGWRTDDLRLQAARLEYLGNDTALRGSRYYRTESPLGYAEIADPSAMKRTVVRGTVRKIDAGQGYLIIRSNDQREHRLWLPSVEITVRNRPNATGYRVGDEVDASVLEFR